MPIAWTDTIDKQLLLVIIHLTAPALPKWSVVAEKMGNDFTNEAVRSRYKKLRKDAEDELGGMTIGNKKGAAGSSDGNVTPKSVGRKQGANKRRKVQAEPDEMLEASANVWDDNDNDDEQSSKVIKSEDENDQL